MFTYHYAIERHGFFGKLSMAEGIYETEEPLSGKTYDSAREKIVSAMGWDGKKVIITSLTLLTPN